MKKETLICKLFFVYWLLYNPDNSEGHLKGTDGDRI